MSDAASPQIIRFGSDCTLRWSFRDGDLLLWLRLKSILGDARDLVVVDLWELRDGDFATLTNRAQDLPPWFELHPTEVAGTLLVPMMARLDAGYQPGPVLDGPNVWRVRAGERLLWIGSARPGLASISGVLAILDCEECLLVLGESTRAIQGLEDMIFGAPSEELPSRRAERARAGVEAVRQLGLPLTYAEDWHLG